MASLRSRLELSPCSSTMLMSSSTFSRLSRTPFTRPPDVMDVDSEEEPEEIEGVSDLDFEAAAPQPAQMGAHSPVASEASVNNLDDF